MDSHDLLRVYIETSALNVLFDELSIEDAISTKAHLNLKGKGWFISPVVLWEIQATTDPLHRERLIFFAQHLFQDALLPSPEEILISFIQAGCPTHEDKYDLVSSGMYSAAWKDICTIKEKTLVINSNQHSFLNGALRKFCKDYYTFTKFNAIDISRDPSTAATQFEVQSLLDYFGLIPHAQRENQVFIRQTRITAFYVLMFLCAGAAIDRHVIERFWLGLGIKDIERRIEYTFTELKALFQRGPMVVIALMTEIQAQRKFSRGMFLDCLHAIYVTYADLFISNDEHFRSFRQEVETTYEMKLRLHMVDELQFTRESRAVSERRSFIYTP